MNKRDRSQHCEGLTSGCSIQCGVSSRRDASGWSRWSALALALNPDREMSLSAQSHRRSIPWPMESGDLTSYQTCIAWTLSDLPDTPASAPSLLQPVLSLELVHIHSRSPIMAMDRVPGQNIYIGGWVRIISSSIELPRSGVPEAQ